MNGWFIYNDFNANIIFCHVIRPIRSLAAESAAATANRASLSVPGPAPQALPLRVTARCPSGTRPRPSGPPSGTGPRPSRPPVRYQALPLRPPVRYQAPPLRPPVRYQAPPLRSPRQGPQGFSSCSSTHAGGAVY